MRYVIGADEVGLGSLAGPLITCAVAVPEDWEPPHGLRDSKKMGYALRETVYKSLYELPMCISVASNEVIDEMGIGMMLTAAHTQAIRELLQYYPDADVILDGNRRLPELPRIRCVPKADSKFPAVMAAACIAKVNRDHIMIGYAKQYPSYGFDSSMGYGTERHLNALNRLGPCHIHRRSYAPVKQALLARAAVLESV
jgi:ribonuclease HII